MSDMDSATFTIRDVNRQLAKVLAACDRLGSVQIRGRNGRRYLLRVEGAPPLAKPFPDFAARRRAAKLKPMTAKQSKALDQLIAGV